MCLSVSLSLAVFPHCYTDPPNVRLSWRMVGCPLRVQYWADLQSVHGFRCYDSIAPNAKCQRVLILAPCLVCAISHPSSNSFLSDWSRTHLQNAERSFGRNLTCRDRSKLNIESCITYTDRLGDAADITTRQADNRRRSYNVGLCWIEMYCKPGSLVLTSFRFNFPMLSMAQRVERWTCDQ